MIDISKYDSKYYKGLGTSSDKEAKECFKEFDERQITYYWEKVKDEISGTDSDDDTDSDIEIDSIKDIDEDSTKEVKKHYSKSHMAIEKAFNGNLSNERKRWIEMYDPSEIEVHDTTITDVPISDFIDKELIEFSIEDNKRSIPSMVDGLKPSQRMILYSCFKRGKNAKEIKVAQLSGYVSQNADYHHGEASLQGAIIGMAQNYPCCSNNINLLTPNGNFGYRRRMGKDHASPRYIFTEMEKITPYIFREEDEEILDYNYDDGKRVEPKNYVPIIPMVLVNGASGIGTGFSSSVPCYNPKDIVTNIKRMINDKKPKQMVPWYNGFKGVIEQDDIKDNEFIEKGCYTIDSQVVHITEIPVGFGSIDSYEKYIESHIASGINDDKILDDIDMNHSNNKIDMKIKFKKKELQRLYKQGKLEKFLKINKKRTVSNIHLFSGKHQIKKYTSPIDVMENFYKYRLETYEKRKNFYLKKLENDLNINKFKVKFIEEYISKKIVLANVAEEDVIAKLEERKYPQLASDHRAPTSNKSYDYLIDMRLRTLTKEKIEQLRKKMNNSQMIYDEYMNRPIKEIWIKELDELLKAYELRNKNWEIEINSSDVNPKKKATKKSTKSKKSTK